MSRKTLLVLLGLGLIAPSAMASPVTLSEVLQRAIANSPAVRSAQASYDLDAAQIQEARAAFFPQLSITGNALQLDGSPVAVFGMPSSGPQSGFGGVAGMTFAKPGEPMVLASATLTQPLFAGFRNLNGYQAALQQAEATGLDLERARRKATFDALDALGAWQQRRASVQALDAMVKKASTRLTWVQARTDAGASGTLDLLQSKVQLARMQSQLADARREAAIAQDLVSERLGGEMTGLEAMPLTWTMPAMTQEEAIALALRDRLDLKAQALLEAASDRQAGASHAGYWPSVSVFGTTSQLGDNSANRGAIVGLQAAWIPFDGLRTQAGIDKANAMSAKRRADREAVTRAVVQEVKQAYADWQAATSLRELRQQELALSEEARRQAETIRSEGALTLTEYTDAEMDRLQARFDLEASRLALRRSELKLATAIGYSPDRLIRQEK
ncbi:Toluene efflux pump outer membrane protein TtgC precursor [compost metagenome]